MTQKEALEILKLGKNVYLTGSAGSGKTYVLNQYIDFLKKNGIEPAITASTGIAATHMNGVTIHSWSGLGVRNYLSEWDLEELESRKYLWDRFQATRVLIIDEVSMLHHFRLDLVDQILRNFRRTNEPFGGIQVVLCGDFFQLPPVSRQGEQDGYFIYHSQAWKDLNPTVCYLEEQHRQKDDVSLHVLNAIRSNDISESVYEHLEARHNKEPNTDIEPTRLYTHNADVDSINNQELTRLDGDTETYHMHTKGRPALIESLKKSCLAPETLILKKGAQVMFVKNNYEAGYVNGTLGKVVQLDPAGPIIETARGKRIVAAPASWKIEEDGKTKAEITQIPLRLAWAITVHKSQGMSLDAVEVDLSKSFEKGMGYVALSRVRSFEGLKLLGINQTALQVNEEVLEFDEILKKCSAQAQDILADIGPHKLKQLQGEFLDSIRPKPKAKKITPHEKTKALVLEKYSLKEMAKKSDKAVSTILTHLEKLVEEHLVEPERELAYLKPERKRFEKMRQAFEKVYSQTGEMKLSPVRDILGSSFNFEELRLARLFIRM